MGIYNGLIVNTHKDLPLIFYLLQVVLITLPHTSTSLVEATLSFFQLFGKLLSVSLNLELLCPVANIQSKINRIKL